MTKARINKCCQEYPNMVVKIRQTAKLINGKIYLTHHERQVLVDWVDDRKIEISKCPHCGAIVKSWIKNNYIIPLSAFPEKDK